MPVRPTALAERLVGIVTRLDSHVGHPALGLPISEVLCHEFLNHAFTSQIFLADRSNVVFLPFAALAGAHPLNSVKAFLIDIAWTRLEILLIPKSQLIADG